MPRVASVLRSTEIHPSDFRFVIPLFPLWLTIETRSRTANEECRRVPAQGGRQSSQAAAERTPPRSSKIPPSKIPQAAQGGGVVPFGLVFLVFAYGANTPARQLRRPARAPALIRHAAPPRDTHPVRLRGDELSRKKISKRRDLCVGAGDCVSPLRRGFCLVLLRPPVPWGFPSLVGRRRKARHGPAGAFPRAGLVAPDLWGACSYPLGRAQPHCQPSSEGHLRPTAQPACCRGPRTCAVRNIPQRVRPRAHRAVFFVTPIWCQASPRGRVCGPRGAGEASPATWLILPVVICLSQRLSHACLSISSCTVKLRMAH